MTLEHVHGPAFLAAIRSAQKAVLDHAETVADGRKAGTLATEHLDALVDAQRHLDTLRLAYITAKHPKATSRPRT